MFPATCCTESLHQSVSASKFSSFSIYRFLKIGHISTIVPFDNRSITDLSLTANKLASLPDEIGDLSLMTILRVDDNKLTSLPESIGRLSRLEELQVGVSSSSSSSSS